MFWQISTRLDTSRPDGIFISTQECFPLFSLPQIYTEWANYYLERAKSKRTVTDLSGKHRQQCKAAAAHDNSFSPRTFNLQQQIAAMDYCSRTSSRLSPIFEYLIWSRSQKVNSKWWVKRETTATRWKLNVIRNNKWYLLGCRKTGSVHNQF